MLQHWHSEASYRTREYEDLERCKFEGAVSTFGCNCVDALALCRALLCVLMYSSICIYASVDVCLRIICSREQYHQLEAQVNENARP